MNIRKSKEFQAIKSVRKDDSPPMLTIKHCDRVDMVELIGGVLEAQFEIDNGYLLLVTEGNPHEEALYIYFLDSSLEIKDSVELSADYTPGILSNVSMIPPNKIRFSFFDKSESWSAAVLHRPKFHFLGNKYPVKRKHPFLYKSWLEIKKVLNGTQN